MANHDRLDELILIYALGALDGEELIDVEEHLKSGCAVCEQTLKDTEMILSLIPYSLPAATPSPRIEDTLFKKIEATKGIKEGSDRFAFWEKLRPVWLGLAGAVALGLLISLFVSNLFLRDRLERREIEIGKLREQAADRSEILAFLENPSAVVINLAGLQPDPNASGKMIWDKKSNRAIFYCINLPQIPPKKTYQIWVIADNTPVGVGIFKVDEKGDSSMKLESLPEADKVQKFAVTLEPEGGMPKPTGQMYLIGAS